MNLDTLGRILSTISALVDAIRKIKEFFRDGSIKDEEIQKKEGDTQNEKKTETS